MANLLSQVGPIFCLSFLGLVSFTGLAEAKLGKSLNRNINDWFDSNIRYAWVIYNTRKYPLQGYILGSGAPGTPGVME